MQALSNTRCNLQRSLTGKCSLGTTSGKPCEGRWTSIAGAICTAERARRAAARVAREEESQALARAWRNLQRSLSGERGLWADPAAWEALHWKLDKTEDPSHRSAQFTQSKYFHQSGPVLGSRATTLCLFWALAASSAWQIAEGLVQIRLRGRKMCEAASTHSLLESILRVHLIAEACMGHAERI